MIQEHERAVGAMPLEWMVIPEAFILLSGALKHARNVLEQLDVDAEKMRRNLAADGGVLMAEAVMMGLAPKIGRNKAHDMVYGASSQARESGVTLREALLSDTEIMHHLSEEEIDFLIDPTNYTGSAGIMVDAVLSRFALTQKNED